MKTLLFDTNSYSLYVKGDRRLRKLVSESNNIYLSAITIGELYAGFYRGNKFELNERIFSKFVSNSHVKVVNVSARIAKTYGKIYFDLKKKGTPLPINDVWIAACAIETDSTLITYDKHFLKIPGVKLWKRI